MAVGTSDLKYSWMRDMPLGVAQEVVNHFSNQYKIIHIRRDDQFHSKMLNYLKVVFGN
jgi:hypothetical protein